MRRADEDFTREIESHIALETDRLIAQGMTPSSARDAALRRFGNVGKVHERFYESRRIMWLDHLRTDAAYAVRTFRRQPGFAAVPLIVLSIAIGLNTSVVTVIVGAMLRPWPAVANPSQVVALHNIDQAGRSSGFSLAEYRVLAERATSFSGLVAARPEGVRFGFENIGRTTGASLVSGNYFDVLGIRMERGRAFRPEEDRLDDPRAVIVISYGLWQRRFGADPAIVGTRVRINEQPFEVVGVASRAFLGPDPGSANVWFPASALPLIRPNDPSVAGMLRNPDWCCWSVAGRLAADVTRARAQAETEVVQQQLRTQTGVPDRRLILTGTASFAQPGRKNQVLAVMGVMFLGVTLLWVLACANVGNLLLARAATRGREIAVRLSLGASRMRVVRQLLTEGLVLALAASAIGIALAYQLPPVVLRLFAGEAGAPFSTTPDALVLGYAAIVAVLSCLIFGLAPALHATRCEVSTALREGSVRGSRLWLRSALLTIQVAVCVVLIVSAGLLLRGVERARRLDPGFRYDDVTVVTFELPVGAYDQTRTRAFFGDVQNGLRQIASGPFGFASYAPLGESRNVTSFRLPGQAEEQSRSITVLNVSPGYFDVLRIPIVAGRNFEPSDAGRHVSLVNETTARAYWPGQNPVGQSFIGGGRDTLEVVGVVRDAYTEGLDGIGTLFYSATIGGGVPTLLFRSSNSSRMDEIAALLARLDPRVRIAAAPLASRVDSWLEDSRVGAMMAGVVGALALALATVGVFGMFAYVVRQRTHEIGIRMALGARPAHVVRFVLAWSGRALLGGLAAGSIGAIASGNLLRSHLYGLSAFDPVSYVAAVVILGAAGLAASYVPARRAARVDPVLALRHE